jgi:hypothetical protein
MTDGRVVTSYQHRFLIRNGVRVWLSEPPADIKRDIEYDLARLKHWPQLIAILNND